MDEFQRIEDIEIGLALIGDGHWLGVNVQPEEGEDFGFVLNRHDAISMLIKLGGTIEQLVALEAASN